MKEDVKREKIPHFKKTHQGVGFFEALITPEGMLQRPASDMKLRILPS